MDAWEERAVSTSLRALQAALLWSGVHVASAFTTRLFSATYRKLGSQSGDSTAGMPGTRGYSKDQEEWDSRTVALAHSIVASQGAVRALLASPPFRSKATESGAGTAWEEVCYGSNAFWDDYLLLTMGYMLYDALVLLWRLGRTRGDELPEWGATLLHHLLIIVTYWGGLNHDPVFGAYYMCCFQVLEASTPFLCARWFLAKMALKGTLVYRANCLLTVASFFALRIVFGSYVLGQIGWFGVWWVDGCYICNVIIYLGVLFIALQYYWFYKLFHIKEMRIC